MKRKYPCFAGGILCIWVALTGILVRSQVPPIAMPQTIKQKWEVLATFTTPYDDPAEQMSLVYTQIPVPNELKNADYIPHAEDRTNPLDNNTIYMLIRGPVQQLEKGHILWIGYYMEGLELFHMGDIAFDPASGRTFVIIGLQGSDLLHLNVYQVNLMSDKRPVSATDPSVDRTNPATTQRALLRSRDIPMRDLGTFAQVFDVAKYKSWPKGEKPIASLDLTQQPGAHNYPDAFGGKRMFVLPKLDSSFMIYLKGYHHQGKTPDALDDPFAIRFDPRTLKWTKVSMVEKEEMQTAP